MLSSPGRTGFLCIIYASESRTELVSQLLTVARSVSGVRQAHHFVDVPYNRTSFYLVSRNASLLCSTALSVCQEAFKFIDYSAHVGTHPTLGSVDHVCFSPLGAGSSVQDEARMLGREFGAALNQQEQVDVYLYGAASPSGARLQNIRRALDYFSPRDRDSRSEHVVSDVLLPSHKGDDSLGQQKGVSCVGVVPLVVNYNIRLTTETSSSKAVASRMTAQLRVEDAVEALTLRWGNQLEIACNLRSSLPEHGPQALFAKASTIAEELGLEIEHAYTTGPSEKDLLDMLDE